MISVAEAKELIVQHTLPLPARVVPLHEAAGLMLAEDIFATNDFPPFRQSAMDGYAFSFDEWRNEPLQINGEVQAGAAAGIEIMEHQAVRIFTGAPLPDSLDTVVMQEKVTTEHGKLHILDAGLRKGDNVRGKGAEIQTGSLGLPAGTYLSAGAIGFVAGLGIGRVKAMPRPIVSIIVTGKELQTPGSALSYGQVYESNSYALTAALRQVAIANVTTRWADDDLEALTAVIEEELTKSDMLLLTGGVSVGDYDFVTKALGQTGVQKVFHKIKQRPGKPLFYGKRGEQIIFGLPGNPSSVLTCYYEYVLLAIQQIIAAETPFLKTIQLPLAADYKKPLGLTNFLKAHYAHGEAMPLDAQESYRMRSFAMANCLIVLDENRGEYHKGELVEVHLLY